MVIYSLIISLDSTFAKDPSLKELSKEKAFEHSTDQVSIGFKAIDKKKIIFKRGILY